MASTLPLNGDGDITINSTTPANGKIKLDDETSGDGHTLTIEGSDGSSGNDGGDVIIKPGSGDNEGKIGIGTTDSIYDCNIEYKTRIKSVLGVEDSDDPLIILKETANNIQYHISAEDIGGNVEGLYIKNPTNTRFSLTNKGAGIDCPDPENSLDVNGNMVIGSSYADSKTAPTNGLLVEGNVGIGRTAASDPLCVNAGANGYGVLLYNSSGTKLARLCQRNTDAGAFDLRDGGNLKINLQADSVSYFNNGNIGIGTTNPQALIHLSNDSAIKPNGGSWSPTSSDKRLKKNIEQLNGALEKICKLSGVTYEWNNPDAHSEESNTGFIAQDIEKIFPAWIVEVEANESDGDLIPDGEKAKTYSLPNEYNAYIVEAIKELKAEIDELKKKIN